MKFLLCLALCLAAAQASVIGLGGPVAYSAVAPVASVYRAPLSLGYSSVLAGAPIVKTYAAPTVYSAPLVKSVVAASSVYSAPLVKSVVAAPSVYSAPAVYSAQALYSAPSVYAPSLYTTLLKK